MALIDVIQIYLIVKLHLKSRMHRLVHKAATHVGIVRELALALAISLSRRCFYLGLLSKVFRVFAFWLLLGVLMGFKEMII